ncbi:hypothetical protein ISS30_06990 [bacterium]|nr:hypothetical protein [bacterium]
MLYLVSTAESRHHPSIGSRATARVAPTFTVYCSLSTVNCQLLTVNSFHLIILASAVSNSRNDGVFAAGYCYIWCRLRRVDITPQ